MVPDMALHTRVILGQEMVLGLDFAAEPVLLLDPEAVTVTVRWSENLGTLSRKHCTSDATTPVQLLHDRRILPCLHTCTIPYVHTLKLVLICLGSHW